MPRAQPGFNLDDYDRLKRMAVELGRQGSFDANDLLAKALSGGGTSISQPSSNAGDVAKVLAELEDAGHLQALGGNPPRWKSVYGPISSEPDPNII
jgi:hypothetical protein